MKKIQKSANPLNITPANISCHAVHILCVVSPDFPRIQKLWKKSHQCLENSLEIFKFTSNIPNQALVLANLSSLMRTSATTYSRRASRIGLDFSPQELQYYDKSIRYCITAQQVRRGVLIHVRIKSHTSNCITAQQMCPKRDILITPRACAAGVK